MQISSTGKITWKLPEKIPSQFYQDNIVGFRITIENMTNKPSPYFSLEYHPYKGTDGGALRPIVVDPDEDDDDGGFSYITGSRIIVPNRALYLRDSLGETTIKLDLKYSNTGDPTSYINLGNYEQTVTILSSSIRPPVSIVEDFKLYPNPVKNSLFIENSGVIDSKVQLLIYNSYHSLTDKRVFIFKKKVITYDSSKLKPGIYYCHIIKDDKTTIKAFVKL